MAKPFQPTMPREGKPYIWTTWLSGILGGKRCLWAAWFKAHFKYQKFEEMASDLARWNREHAELMRKRRAELEREGFYVTEESENDFKVEGECATIAGKADLVGRKPGLALVVDGKTGRERDSDIHQVLIYLWALPKQYPDLRGRELEGEVQYARGDERLALSAADLTPAYVDTMVGTIKLLGAPDAPAKAPSRDECRFCNIGPKDCPERVGETPTVREMAF